MEIINKQFAPLKIESDELAVEFEILPVKCNAKQRTQVQQGLARVDTRLTEVENELIKLNTDIDELTNHADGIDYTISVICGIVAGMIDIVFVGEWNFEEAKSESYERINNKVIGFAKKQPDYNLYCNFALDGKGNPRKFPKDPDRLETAIRFLEWKFHLPGDGAYGKKGVNVGISGETHRLDDLCHHPNILGLVSSIIVQFTGETKYVNKFGESINFPISINEYGNFVGNNFVTKLFSGIINWFITCAKTVSNWKGHLYSDVSTPAGLPSTFLSLITELAEIPCFRNEKFLIELRKAYTDGFGTGKNQVDLKAFNSLFEGAKNKLDISTEKAVFHELNRQALPAVINELLVRGSYFIKRFILELKEKNDVFAVEWKNVIPFDNRTIVRMMTIATGTFTAIDMADASIRSATKSADVTSFFSNLVLRVNFVGVGRFAIAVGTDSVMGISRYVKVNRRIDLQKTKTLLLDSKVYYLQADVWTTAESTEETLQEAYRIAETTTMEFVHSLPQITESLKNIATMAESVEKNNPGLLSEIDDILKS